MEHSNSRGSALLMSQRREYQAIVSKFSKEWPVSTVVYPEPGLTASEALDYFAGTKLDEPTRLLAFKKICYDANFGLLDTFGNAKSFFKDDKTHRQVVFASKLNSELGFTKQDRKVFLLFDYTVGQFCYQVSNYLNATTHLDGKRYEAGSFGTEDLISSSSQSIFSQLSKFDLSCNNKFMTMALPRLKFGMVDAIRKYSYSSSRDPSKRVNVVSIHDFSLATTPNADDEIDLSDVLVPSNEVGYAIFEGADLEKYLINSAIKKIAGSRSRRALPLVVKIIDHRLKTDEPLSLAEIGAMHDVTESRVSQVNKIVGTAILEEYRSNLNY